MEILSVCIHVLCGNPAVCGQELYEAADMDGATSWQKFLAVTYPAIKPTLVTVVSLRTIWVFYIYTEVYLLTKQVNVLGVYLYDMAFATHDSARQHAIPFVLFVVIFTCYADQKEGAES